MKAIINGYVYDTETAELIYVDTANNRRYYVTPNRRFFFVCFNGIIQCISEESVKKILGEHDYDKYVELFGEPRKG